MADPGDTLPFRADVYSSPDGGTLVNAASVSLTITLPDGTTASPSVTNPPAVTGKYRHDYVTTLASPSGRYVGQWVFTFAGGATTSYVETFDVGGSLVTVDEALAHLRASDIIVGEDQLDYLQWLCFVATEAIELDLGRVLVPQTVVEIHNGGGSIVLDKSPVLSITSVMESGYALTTSDYLVDSAGILYRGTSTYVHAFSRGVQNVVVTYRAGYNNPPRVARKVALNFVQGAWQGAQQAPHPALQDYNSEPDLGPAIAQLLPLERSAYESLRAAAVA